MKVLVTGASGFIGRAVVRRLADEPGMQVRAAFRTSAVDVPADERVESIITGDLSTRSDLTCALDGCQSVVHTAARVHVLLDRESDALAAYRAVNVHGTMSLAQRAVDAGVRRFIFISSIKVNGESTVPGRPFTADDPPTPRDPYGVSKLEAEEGLRTLGRETGLEVVIIRPVLVYGPGVKANFEAMLRMLYRGVPLPLGSVRNRRSLVALDNLIDLVIRCLRHPDAVGRILLVSDGEDLSTPDLLRRAARAMGKQARLVPVPVTFLERAAAFAGKRAIAQRLCGSLTVDISSTCHLLDWAPPLSVDDALRSAVEAFCQHYRQR